MSTPKRQAQIPRLDLLCECPVDVLAPEGRGLSVEEGAAVLLAVPPLARSPALFLRELARDARAVLGRHLVVVPARPVAPRLEEEAPRAERG
jgi:hypothetical protein